MKRLSLGVGIAAGLLAQSGSKLEVCGEAKGHECHCRRLTLKIQAAAEKKCRTLEGDKRIQCLAAVPFHCDLVDLPSYDLLDLDPDQDSTMSDHCTMHCAKHDCKCDQDGAVCHVGHLAKEHR